MANSKDNISKYATSFIGFDEVSGNVYDNIGGYTGTIYNAPTRVTGWNGEGKGMSFNGSGQYVQFNQKVIPIGAKNIRFKIKTTQTSYGMVMTQTVGSAGSGTQVLLDDGKINFLIGKSVSGTPLLSIYSNKVINDGIWHDILFTWDGTINTNGVKIYIDDMINPNSMGTAISSETLTPTYNLMIAKSNVSATPYYFNGQLDEIEIYDKVVSPIPDKYLIFHNNQYKYHNGTSWLITTNTEANFIQYGMNNLDHITETQWLELSGEKSLVMWSNFEDKKYASAVLNTAEFTAQDLIGENPEAVYYTESNIEQVIVETEVEPYSVYDYISETPTAVVYTESTSDIMVSTTTEPYDLYDEFGDEVEVLYYTDDEAVKEADLILEANWSPIDELEGNFEVVTWTDEPQETAQRVLEMTAIPKPQFIKLVNPKRLYGYLDDVLAVDASMSYRDEVRYLFSGQDSTKWYVWNKKTKVFEQVDASTHELILKNGMKHGDLAELIQDDWRTWKEDYMNIGIFLKDNPRDTIVSVVDNVSYQDYLPRHSTEVEKANFYILNTTAKIDIELNGNVLSGFLSDDDLTRVQYRVLLNGANYYPVDGSFTKLGEAPQNIELIIGSKDIKIDDWNTIKVEFQDFFGTTDYWSTQFIGTYSGLMFKDVYGQYYSSEIGDILQYLDFGVIIAGQTTLEHEVILKNQYGYDVKNIHLYANTSAFPNGMKLDFSQSQTPFTPQPELKLNRTLLNNEEMSFFLRLKTELGATPDANGSFDIIVKADRA